VSGTTTTGNVDITRTLVVSGNETLKNIDQFDTIVIRNLAVTLFYGNYNVGLIIKIYYMIIAAL